MKVKFCGSFIYLIIQGGWLGLDKYTHKYSIGSECIMWSDGGVYAA